MKKIKKITEINYEDDVYNLHVRDNHNYIANNFIVSNCHGLAATSIKKIVNDNGAHIQYRYGVTGTMPKGRVDQMNLKISIGSVVAEIDARWLIDNGHLSELEITPIETQEDRGLSFPEYANEKSYLARHDDRLVGLASQIIKCRDLHGNTFVLVNSIAQGRTLQSIIDGSIFLSGESETELRKHNYDQFADRDDLIVIATFGIASTGISINRIFCLVMIDGGKSFVRAIQTIGRSLRRSGDKSKAWVYDIYSSMTFSKKHARERIKYYKEAKYPVNKTTKLDYS